MARALSSARAVARSASTPPENSALNTRLPSLLPESWRITVMNSITIPAPPSQWLSERQMRMLWGMISISAMAVAPVVVKPEKLSKMAETGSGKQW